MTKIERNLLDFIKKHISIVAVSVVTLIVLMFYIYVMAYDDFIWIYDLYCFI